MGGRSTFAGTGFQNRPVTIQRKAQAIPHERLHIIGRLSGSPNNFNGFRDRGHDRSTGGEHFNMLWSYDMMYHHNPLLPLHSLYNLPPILSHDLIYLGWIESDEILEVDINNFASSEIKLADVNYPLNTTQINDGYRRIIKVMIHENYQNTWDEYFLIEYHNATEFDKAFANYDEYQTNGYNTGILIWHIRERHNELSTGSDNQIDLEVAIPYNGWYGNPIPAGYYPRDYDRSPTNQPHLQVWNGNNAGDFDYLDDAFSYYDNPNWVFEFIPDGGRHIWETTKPPPHPWYPQEPNLFYRLQSMQSDFFSDEEVKGLVLNKLSDVTRPSSKDWNGHKSHIAITNIRHGSGCMKFDIDYNYWAGEITENSTMSGNVTVEGNLTVVDGVTLTIAPGTTIEFLNGATLKVYGTLTAVGTSNNRITFTNSSGTWGGIKFYSGSSGDVKFADISNATYGVYINGATPNVQNCEITSTTYGIYVAGSYSTDWGSDPIKDNDIKYNTSGYGIYLYNSSPTLNGNTVEGNNRGIAMFTNCNPVVTLNNINSNVYYGLACYGSSSPLAYYLTTQNPKGGYNQVRSNGAEEVKITGTSNPNFGHYFYGNNSFTDDDGYLMYNSTSNTIKADKNWWGSASGPSAGQLYGSILYFHYLRSDPNASQLVYKPGDTDNQTTTSDLLSKAMNAFYEGNYQDAASLFREYIMKNYTEENVISVVQYYIISLSQVENKGSVISAVNQLKNLSMTTRAQADLSGLYAALLERNGNYSEAIAELDDAVTTKATTENKNQLMLQKAHLLIHSLGQKEKGEEVLTQILKEEKQDSYLYEIASSELMVLESAQNQLPKGGAISAEDEEKPTEYSLANNYPNPFNPSTTISFSIPEEGKVELVVYDILGRKVAELVNETLDAGKYNVNFDGRDLSSGMYIYKITAGSFTESKKMLLLK